MEKRRPLTRSQLAELVLEQMGKCRNCGERLDFAKKGQVVDEHIVPLFSGGTNETSNRALFCKPCATEKTTAETPDRAKVRRIEGKKTQADKRAKAKAEGRHRKMGSKPWPKATGPSALSKDSERAMNAILTEENERLREALKPFASYAAEWDDPTAYGLDEPWPDTELAYDPVVRIEIGDFRRARAALKETTDD